MAEHRAHQLAGHSRKPRTPDGPRLLKSSESNESRSSNALRQKTVADVCERRQSPQAVRMGSPGGGLVVGAAAVLGRMCLARWLYAALPPFDRVRGSSLGRRRWATAC